MTIDTAAFSDYYAALAVRPLTNTPRPMRDMAEAFSFHAEIRNMPQTLRLDFEESGCNHRAELIAGLLRSRNLQHGQAVMAFPYDHKDVFECAAYGFVETDQGLQRVVFSPLRDTPELWPHFERRIKEEGAIMEWSIISDGMGGKGPPQEILQRLHSEGTQKYSLEHA